MHLPTDADCTDRVEDLQLFQRLQRRRVRRCALLALGCAVLFALLLGLVKSGWAPVAGPDHGLVDWAHGTARQHTAWTAAMQTLTDLGGPVVMRGMLGLVAIWLWAVRARTLAGWAAAQLLVGWAVEVMAKDAVGRARPSFPDPVSHAAGAAFPSGHAMASAITCAALVALVWPHANRAGRVVACALAGLAVLTVGWTRIALGVHWPTDVLAGWLASGLVFCALTVTIELWRPGALVRDVRRIHWRNMPRVQRVLVEAPEAGPLVETDPARAEERAEAEGEERRRNDGGTTERRPSAPGQEHREASRRVRPS